MATTATPQQKPSRPIPSTQVGELVKNISCSAKTGLRMYYIDLRKSQAARYFVRFTQGRGYRTMKQNISIDQSDMPYLMDALENFSSKTKARKVMGIEEKQEDSVEEEIDKASGEEETDKEVEDELKEKKKEEEKNALGAESQQQRRPVVIPGPEGSMKYETPSGTTIEIMESFSMISSNLRRKWFVDLKKTATRGHFITFKQKTDLGNQTIFIDIVDFEKIIQSLRELYKDMVHLIKQDQERSSKE